MSEAVCARCGRTFNAWSLHLPKTPDNPTAICQKCRAHPQVGEKRPAAKLTEYDVIQIRRRCETESQRSLAREYGVNENTIALVRKRKAWRHVA